jgi:hypothetical protein
LFNAKLGERGGEKQSCMKKFFKFVLFVAICFTMSSCYTYTVSVGKGAQSGKVVSAKNHYLIDGLAAIKTADAKELIGDAKDYDLTITHSFVDGLIQFITGGIYTPTTVSVTK